MLLQSFLLDLPPQETNHYLLADMATRIGLLVDAGGFDPEIIQLANEYRLTMTHILLTHLHWDHTDALGDYLRYWPDALVVTPEPIPGIRHKTVVHPGDVLAVGPFSFQVLDTSGHTPESISYYCPQKQICFVGDALFAGAVGGTSTDSLFDRQIDNIQRHIMTLPGQTEILPGHGPMTTVLIEKTANPFLQPGFTRTAH